MGMSFVMPDPAHWPVGSASSLNCARGWPPSRLRTCLRAFHSGSVSQNTPLPHSQEGLADQLRVHEVPCSPQTSAWPCGNPHLDIRKAATGLRRSNSPRFI